MEPTSGEGAGDPSLSAAAEDALIDDFYRTYVQMVLYARKGAGNWSEDDELSSFTIYLREPTVICINDEDSGWSVARTKRSFQPGEVLDFDDVTSDQVPRPAHQRPYFRAVLTASGWQADSDLTAPHPASAELLEAAAEFLGAAEQAHAAGAFRAFVENAFHAAESLARLELLSYPVVAAELEGSRKHPHVQSVYDLWLRLGNTDARFPALLRDLHSLRASATYVNKPFTLDRQIASEMLRTLRDLAAHAKSVARSTKGRTVNFISTRAIAAGEPVSSGDVTIRRRRERRRPSD